MDLSIIHKKILQLAAEIAPFLETKNEPMQLIHLDLVPQAERVAFANEVIKISAYLGINPNWLLQVMYAESKLKPWIENENGGATGLIQFMPATAVSLGTTTAALKRMTRLQQLQYVKKYYAWKRGKMKSYFDVYLVTFFPAALGQNDNYIFKTSRLSPGIIARQNKIMDYNKNGAITMAEFKKYIVDATPKNVRALVFNNDTNDTNGTNGTNGTILIGIALIAFVLLG